MHDKIPFFDYPFIFKENEEKFVEIFKEVGRRGAFIMQSDLSDFESNLAKFAGCNYAVGVSNGTDSLLMSLRACGIKPGDEVIFSSHTFIATASAIHFAGGVPVPVECGSDHQIDPSAVEKAITSKTKFLMPTQLNGRCCNMDALGAISKKYDLTIIEDSAQALGAKFKGTSAGTFGACGSISFYPAKVLGCFGDGGAILTNDKNIYNQLRMMRDHGRNPSTGNVEAWGLNLRMDNLQAAFLNFKLQNYPNVIRRRREIASLYNEGLKEIKELSLPPAPGSNPDYFDIFQNYEIRAQHRNSLKDFLAKNNVGTLVQWGGQAVHQFEELKLEANLPYTEKLMTEIILLPLNMSLTDGDINHICSLIERFYKT